MGASLKWCILVVLVHSDLGYGRVCQSTDICDGKSESQGFRSQADWWGREKWTHGRRLTQDNVGALDLGPVISKRHPLGI